MADTSGDEQRYTGVSAPFSLVLAKGLAKLKRRFPIMDLFWVPNEVDTNPGWRQFTVTPLLLMRFDNFLVNKILASLDYP